MTGIALVLALCGTLALGIFVGWGATVLKIGVLG